MENNNKTVGCELCNIRECGTGYPEHTRNGWVVTIKKDKETNFVSLVIENENEFIEYSIGYCPNCGKEL